MHFGGARPVSGFAASLAENAASVIAPGEDTEITVSVTPNAAETWDGVSVLVTIMRPKPREHFVPVRGDVFAPRFYGLVDGTRVAPNGVFQLDTAAAGGVATADLTIINELPFSYEVTLACLSAKGSATAFSVQPASVFLPASSRASACIAFNSGFAKTGAGSAQCRLVAHSASVVWAVALSGAVSTPEVALQPAVGQASGLFEDVSLLPVVLNAHADAGTSGIARMGAKSANEFEVLLPVRTVTLYNRSRVAADIQLATAGPYDLLNAECSLMPPPLRVQGFGTLEVRLRCNLARALTDRSGSLTFAYANKTRTIAVPYSVTFTGPDVDLDRDTAGGMSISSIQGPGAPGARSGTFRLRNKGGKASSLFLYAPPASPLAQARVEFKLESDLAFRVYPAVMPDVHLLARSEADFIAKLGIDADRRKYANLLSLTVPPGQAIEVKVTLQHAGEEAPDFRLRAALQSVSVIAQDQAAPTASGSLRAPHVIRLRASTRLLGKLDTKLSGVSPASTIDPLAARTIGRPLLSILGDWLSHVTSRSATPEDAALLSLLSLRAAAPSHGAHFAADAFASAVGDTTPAATSPAGIAALEAAGVALGVAFGVEQLEDLGGGILRRASQLRVDAGSATSAALAAPVRSAAVLRVSALVCEALLDAAAAPGLQEPLLLVSAALQAEDTDALAAFVAPAPPIFASPQQNSLQRFVASALAAAGGDVLARAAAGHTVEQATSLARTISSCIAGTSLADRQPLEKLDHLATRVLSVGRFLRAVVCVAQDAAAAAAATAAAAGPGPEAAAQTALLRSLRVVTSVADAPVLVALSEMASAPQPSPRAAAWVAAEVAAAAQPDPEDGGDAFTSPDTAHASHALAALRALLGEQPGAGAALLRGVSGLVAAAKAVASPSVPEISLLRRVLDIALAITAEAPGSSADPQLAGLPSLVASILPHELTGTRAAVASTAVASHGYAATRASTRRSYLSIVSVAADVLSDVDTAVQRHRDADGSAKLLTSSVLQALRAMADDDARRLDRALTPSGVYGQRLCEALRQLQNRVLAGQCASLYAVFSDVHIALISPVTQLEIRSNKYVSSLMTSATALCCALGGAPRAAAEALHAFGGLAVREWSSSAAGELVPHLGTLGSGATAANALAFAAVAASAVRDAPQSVLGILDALHLFSAGASTTNAAALASVLTSILPPAIAVTSHKAVTLFVELQKGGSADDALQALSAVGEPRVSSAVQLGRAVAAAASAHAAGGLSAAGLLLAASNAALSSGLVRKHGHGLASAKCALDIVVALSSPQDIVTRAARLGAALLFREVAAGLDVAVTAGLISRDQLVPRFLRRGLGVVSSGALEALLQEAYGGREPQQQPAAAAVVAADAPLPGGVTAGGAADAPSPPQIPRSESFSAGCASGEWFPAFGGKAVTPAPPQAPFARSTSAILEAAATAAGQPLHSPPIAAPPPSAAALALLRKSWTDFGTQEAGPTFDVLRRGTLDLRVTGSLDPDALVAALPGLSRHVGRWVSLYTATVRSASSSARGAGIPAADRTTLDECALISILHAVQLARSIRVCQEGLSSALRARGHRLLREDLRMLLRQLDPVRVNADRLPLDLREALDALFKSEAETVAAEEAAAKQEAAGPGPRPPPVGGEADPFAHLRVMLTADEMAEAAEPPLPPVDAAAGGDDDGGGGGDERVPASPPPSAAEYDLPEVVAVDTTGFRWKEVGSGGRPGGARRGVGAGAGGVGSRAAALRLKLRAGMKAPKVQPLHPQPGVGAGGAAAGGGAPDYDADVDPEPEVTTDGRAITFKAPPLTASDIREMLKGRNRKKRGGGSLLAGWMGKLPHSLLPPVADIYAGAGSSSYSGNPSALRDRGLDALSTTKASTYTYQSALAERSPGVHL